jgi:hypothetical protein
MPAPPAPLTEADLAAIAERVSDVRWRLTGRGDEAYFRVLSGLERLALEDVPRLVAEVRRLQAALATAEGPAEPEGRVADAGR